MLRTRAIASYQLVSAAACSAVLLVGAVRVEAQCEARWLYSPEQAAPSPGWPINQIYLWQPDGGADARLVAYIPPGLIAAWDGREWEPLGRPEDAYPSVAAFATFSGHLYAVGSGRNFVGGRSSHLARWNGSTWESLAGEPTGLQSRFLSAVEFDGNLIVSGRFTAIGGTAARNIARFDGTSWHPLGDGLAAEANLAATDGRLFAALVPTSSGAPIAVREWNGQEWTDLPPLQNSLQLGGLPLIATLNGQPVIGGARVPTAPNSRIVRWDGSAWQPLGTFLSPTALHETNGMLYASGVGLDESATFVVGLCWRWSGTEWTKIGGAGEFAASFAVFDGELFAGGNYRTIDGRQVDGVVRFDGSTWLPVSSGIGGPASAFATYRDDLVVSGAFTVAGGHIANNVARWDGRTVTPMGDGLDRRVLDFTQLDGSLIAAGEFIRSGERSVRRVARWDDTEWRPLGNGFNSVAHAVAVHDGHLYAGGSFTASGSNPVRRIGVWNGMNWEPVGGGMNGDVYSLLSFGGDLIAAGAFSTAGSQAVNRIAAWDGSTWRGLGAGFDGYVLDLMEYRGELIAAGTFVTSGADPALGVARWTGYRWERLGTGLGGVNSLTVIDDELFAGGTFTSGSGATLNFVARWRGQAWKPLGTGVDDLVNVVASHRGELVIGGAFAAAEGTTSWGWARWSPTGMPWVAEQPAPARFTPGRTLTMRSAVASGYGDVEFRWLRNGVPISDGPQGASAGGGVVTGASGTLVDGEITTLTVAEAQASDAGEFRVEFTSQCGSVTSNAAAASVCRADRNADGIVTLDDLLGYLGSYFAMEPDADFDGNGQIEAADVVEFVTAFLAGC